MEDSYDILLKFSGVVSVDNLKDQVPIYPKQVAPSVSKRVFKYRSKLIWVFDLTRAMIVCFNQKV